MKQALLNLLACPQCRGDLTLANSTGDAEILTGELRCAACARSFPIVGGIPRFVPDEEYAGSFGHQWLKYARLQLDSNNGSTFSRDRFYSITEWSPENLRGRRVLDVGCGSGSFAEIALAAGAEVVALDLSRAVDACMENLGASGRLDCVQGSIFELPFKDFAFDYVYCIGVIQHTPDPERAVKSIVKKVAREGQAGFWIYELCWKSFVGTIGFKYLLRPITKRLSISQTETFSIWMEALCWPVNCVARHMGTLGRLVMRMLPVSCAHLQGIPLSAADFREWVRLDTFDMYSPAHDHPQRFETVARWLEDEGIAVAPRHPHGAVSITGRRRQA